ncbi:hypothetical protein PIB30_009374 [Stylosanthes scabra]|uniref:Uncharacterized protein n=1 Tax=Stylosanthes scabra TaxID=79078 RepID=A0ABU6V3F7_9FABA|nr:hypothetical protein [Stylosanthes scabra]
MEGLLPLMYRAIKKHTARRQYQCLSPSARALLDYDFNINMAHHQETSIQNNSNAVVVDDDNRARAENNGHHRRYNSTGEFYGRSYSTTTRGPASADSKQLVRFRSHRKFFSCVTG